MTDELIEDVGRMPVDTETKPTAADGEQPQLPLMWNDDDGELTAQEVPND